MFYVYILQSSNGKFYIGYTADLRNRLKQHLAGHTRTTRIMKNPKLIYYEAYIDEDLAKEREKKLKQFGSSYHGLMKRIKKI